MGGVQTRLEPEPTAGRQFTLVVAVANPAHLEQLMRTALDVATDRDGRIRVVNVVHKPVTSPFRLFSTDRIKREFAGGQRAVLDEAAAIADDAPVPVECELLVGSDVSDAILSLVEDAGADALLLGWQDRPRPSDIVLGTTVDPLVRRAPCDVFVERMGTTTERVESILLPTDGGPHVESATELAGAIARVNDAIVRVVSYVETAADDVERERAREHVRVATERLPNVRVDADVREARTAANAIVTAAADHDLVVLGATRESRLRNRVVGSVAAEVGRRATVPIVIAKRRSDASLLERAFGWF